jgi:hypothetical protein
VFFRMFKFNQYISHNIYTLLKTIFTASWRDRMGWSGLDWIDMAQDRDRWRSLVNTVLNLLVP